MRISVTFFALMISLMNSCFIKEKSDELFVFVGENISSYPIKKNSDGYVKLKYRILEKTFGNYEQDTIEFFAYYNADSLKFTSFKHCLLFLHRDGRNFYKLALSDYDVYRTQDGRWASGAKWWQYTPELQTSIKPVQLHFKDQVYLDLTDLSQEEIDHWYPKKYYERKDNRAIPILGNYTNELFEINKKGMLNNYFPSENHFLSEKQINDAVLGWQKAGILSNLTKEEISTAKRQAFSNKSKNLNEVIINFPKTVYWFDTELENLNDPYAEFVRKLAEISHGAFAPTKVNDNFTNSLELDVTVSFLLNNKNYSQNLKIQDDWIDISIFDFIKQVVRENNIKGQFYELYEGGQGGLIIFLTDEQHNYLKKNELLIFTEEE